METCPNCGQQLPEAVDVCPNCGFNLKKYRDTFFTDQHENAPFTDQQEEGKKIAKRAAYRAEFYPEQQNGTVKKMIEWVRKNATIVYLLGVFLLVVMSFSRLAGWVLFLALMIWLYVICERASRIEQYTADLRLTQKINQVGSNVFNKLDKNRSRREAYLEEKHPKVNDRVKQARKRRVDLLGLTTMFLALVTLIVVFAGAGASVDQATYNQKLSISNTLLTIGAKLLGSSKTFTYGIMAYVVWLLLIVLPLVVLVQTWKGMRKNRLTAFLVSLVETISVVYSVMQLSSSTTSQNWVGKFTSQLQTYATSIGTSTMLLVLASVITTALTGWRLIKHDNVKKASDEREAESSDEDPNPGE